MTKSFESKIIRSQNFTVFVGSQFPGKQLDPFKINFICVWFFGSLLLRWRKKKKRATKYGWTISLHNRLPTTLPQFRRQTGQISHANDHSAIYVPMLKQPLASYGLSRLTSLSSFFRLYGRLPLGPGSVATNVVTGCCPPLGGQSKRLLCYGEIDSSGRRTKAVPARETAFGLFVVL